MLKRKFPSIGITLTNMTHPQSILTKAKGQSFFEALTSFPVTRMSTSLEGKTQQIHQRWNNFDRQRSSTLFQCWYLVENGSWADVHLSNLF